jgi:hypothetical protein
MFVDHEPDLRSSSAGHHRATHAQCAASPTTFTERPEYRAAPSCLAGCFGTSYRSAIFYLDDDQRRVAQDTMPQKQPPARIAFSVVMCARSLSLGSS